MRSTLSAAGLPVLLYLALALALPWSGSQAGAAETRDAVTISVEDVSAKLGEKATLVARITPREGFRIADAYRNRITTLSAADDGVQIDGTIVRGTMQGASLVFKIPVTATKPGPHAINGVIRFAFVSSLGGDDRLDIKWEPLIATVTGTQ
jgi:hypothetical protein